MAQMDGVEEDDLTRSHIAKTIAFSPVINDIFEANLRTPDSRDIIFVKVNHQLILPLTI